jgi:signal transduction histidine kinase
MKRLLPDGIAARFALLLATALLAATIIALVALAFDRIRFDRAAMVEREVERILGLVPALEAVPPEARARVAREASTRFARVTVDAAPLVRDTPVDMRSRGLARLIARDLPDRPFAAGIMRQQLEGRGDRRVDTIVISIAIGDPADGTWLNVRAAPPVGAAPGLDADVVFLVFGLSLVAVLGAGLIFIRRLTRPIDALARAAQSAGRGDRSVRLAEDGPRELRAAARAFNDMQVRIARFDAERLRTLGAVGHDLRTPITSLRIRAEMLDDTDLRDNMVRTLDDMAVMADGLVSFAKGARDDEPVQDIALVPFLATLAKDRSATFPGGPDLHLRARPVALTRAIGNLVDNALRYGGSAEIALSCAGDDAVITISDDGPGIPPERLPQIFDPFVRGDDSRSAETGGAGLGLSIAQTIVQALGGTIRLANRNPTGLTATISLPLMADR